MNKGYFMKGKINFLLDGNAGSSGKGKISDYLVDVCDVDFLITSNSANASHTVVQDNKEYVFKVLPSGSLHHDKLKTIYITDGSSFDIESLMSEIEMIGIPRTKIVISPRAGIIQKIDKDYEAGLCDLNGSYSGEHSGTIKTGTTASGSGSVLAKKVLRNSTLVTAGDIDSIKDMVDYNISQKILDDLEAGQTGFFEIGQGFPLSNNHKLFAPFTTSRNVTVSSALNDAFLPPHVCGNVIINFRTYPIKIHSNKYKAKKSKMFKYTEEEFKAIKSKHTLFNHKIDKDIHIVSIKKGDFLSWYEKDILDHDVVESPSGEFYPDQEEITWDILNDRLGLDKDTIFETTTLTKLPRRIAEFSNMNYIDAIQMNDTGNKIIISLNFVNYVDPSLFESTSREALIKSKIMEDWGEKYLNIAEKYQGRLSVSLIGTGASREDIIDMSKL